MTNLRPSDETILQGIREFVSVAMMSVLIGGLFMAFMLFAWTVRTTAGALHVIRHPLSAFHSHTQQLPQPRLHRAREVSVDHRRADEADA